MATMTGTDWVGLYKTVYPDASSIEEVIYKSNPLLALLAKDTDFDGENMKQPIVFGDISGSSSSFAAAKANSGKILNTAFYLTRKKMYQMAVLDHELMMASKKNSGSFIEAFQNSMESAQRGLTNQISVYLFGSGTGKLGQIVSTQGSSSTTLTLEVPEDIRKLHINQPIAPSAAESGGSAGTTVFVKTVDETAGTFTVAATMGGAALTATQAGLTAAIYIFQGGDYGNVLQGLQGWIPSSVGGSDNFFGVNRSIDRRRLAGNYASKINMPIVEAILEGDTINSLGGGMTDYCVVHPMAFLAIQKEQVGKVMYTDVMVGSDAKIGFKGIKFIGASGEFTVLADRNCPKYEAFLLQSNTWKLKSLGDLVSLWDADGNVSLRSSSEDSLEFQMFSYAQLSCRAPGFNSRIAIKY